MKTSIIVQNLKCGGCAKTISTKLSKLPNISSVEVVVDTAEVFFECHEETDAITAIDTLKHLGYPSIEDANTLATKAKSFVSCATGKMIK
ncbi:MAG: heavy metal-associated domain-containing protein [Flavobacteriaceae bacterium]